MPELGLMLPILGIRSSASSVQAYKTPADFLRVGEDAGLNGFVFARGGHRFIYRKSLLRLIDGLLQDI